MNDVLDGVLADLKVESDRLEGWIVGLPLAAWRTPTPAEGWDVATSIAHLAWTDECAVLAAGATTGQQGKKAWDELVLKALEDPTGFVDAEAFRVAELQAGDLLDRWKVSRRNLADALRALPQGTKMPWFGPPMSGTSMATARFMETWAHGLDVADALGVVPEPTDRVRHVAHIGVRARNFAFTNNALEAPTEEFRVELTAPSGALWTWGPEDAAQRVNGPAYDVALLVTQRRHRDDLTLKATGPDAEKWLDIAQAFAGPAGGGREALGG